MWVYVYVYAHTHRHFTGVLGWAQGSGRNTWRARRIQVDSISADAYLYMWSSRLSIISDSHSPVAAKLILDKNPFPPIISQVFFCFQSNRCLRKLFELLSMIVHPLGSFMHANWDASAIFILFYERVLSRATTLPEFWDNLLLDVFVCLDLKTTSRQFLTPVRSETM